MHSLRLAVCTLSILALSGCGDDTAHPDDALESCLIDDGPTLLLAAPVVAAHEEEPWLFSFFADDTRLRWSQQDAFNAGTAVFQRDLCGGEPEQVLSAEHGLTHTFTAQGPVGPILFGSDQDGRFHIVDRLDVPGADVPRPLAQVTPKGLISVQIPQSGGFDLVMLNHNNERPTGVAALGGNTKEIWMHNGSPDDDLALIATDAVSTASQFTGEPGRWVLRDDGSLSFFNHETLEETPILHGVRSFTRLWRGERPFLLYQAIGDGHDEAVYLLDLTDQSQLQLSTNPFTAVSFGLDPEHSSTGRWITRLVLGLIGPEGSLTEVFDPATLEPLPVPEHIGLADIGAPHALGLRLADPSDHVYALWDPAEDTLVEWYRGPAPPSGGLRARWQDDEVRYQLPNTDDTIQLVAFDPITRTRRTLVERLGLMVHELDDGRIVHSLSLADTHDRQVVLSDPATGQTTTLVERTHSVQVLRSAGLLLYTDADAETPGLWALRLPPH